MDEETKKKHRDDLFNEWLPAIHAKATQLHQKYPNRVKQPADLHEAGMMGLMSAFKDFDPAIAKVKQNNFMTYADKKIQGEMQNRITGLHSHDVEDAFDPHFEQQTRDFARKQKNMAASEQPPAIPSAAGKPPAIPSAADKPHWEDD